MADFIVIWTANNANEQTGFRYLIYMLKEKSNDIYLLNSSLSYKELYVPIDDEHFYHTGLIHPEKLRGMYEKDAAKVLSTEERSYFQKEWPVLSESREVLRIWKNREITFGNETHFDLIIMSTIQKLHEEQGKMSFLLTAKIIGEVLGQMEQSISDVFLEYRIRELVYSGVLEIKGIPKDMRSYSVRVKNSKINMNGGL